jgi:hypothetical protein
MSSKFAQNFNKVSLIFGESLAVASFVSKYFRSKAIKIQTENSELRTAQQALNANAVEHAVEHAELQEGVSALVKTNNRPYRPSQWDNKDLVYAKTSVGGYFFDAVLKIDHTSTIKITEHPVQNGANTADHAFKLPDRVVLEIGMSDCMDAYISGQFSGHKSKSISAYQTLRNLQLSFTPLELTTRLENYKNMLIEQISTPDDFKSLTGLKCTITLKQLITGEVDTVLVSSRPQVTAKPKAIAAQPKQPDSTVASKLENAAFGTPKKEYTMLKAH